MRRSALWSQDRADAESIGAEKAGHKTTGLNRIQRCLSIDRRIKGQGAGLPKPK